MTCTNLHVPGPAVLSLSPVSLLSAFLFPYSSLYFVCAELSESVSGFLQCHT